MPECKKCGKKGLFLKIENDSGLCLSCNEDFSRTGKRLTARIMEAKTGAARSQTPEQLRTHCSAIEKVGEKLLGLHREYGLEPSRELLDLIETYRNMAGAADVRPR